MMFKKLKVVFIGFLLGIVFLSHARANEEKIVFYNVAGFAALGAATETLISGGRKVVSSDFKEIYYKEGDHDDKCTGVLITKNDLLTAKHCLDGKTNIYIDYHGDRLMSLPCKPHRSSNVDLIICSFSKDFKHGINLSSDILEVNQEVEMLGIGCDRTQNDFDLRMGRAFVRHLPSNKTKRYVIGQSTTHPEKLTATICLGDSGGPTYIYVNKDRLSATKLLVGINSECPKTTDRVNCADTGLSMIEAIAMSSSWLNENTIGEISWK